MYTKITIKEIDGNINDLEKTFDQVRGEVAKLSTIKNDFDKISIDVTIFPKIEDGEEPLEQSGIMDTEG